MQHIKPIRSEADHAAALARIDTLIDAEPGTPEDDELDLLVDLVEHYESKHHPLDCPTPLAALQFRMEQAGLTPRDLEPFLGSRGKVSEVLSGKRPITLPMARALHEHLGIPAEVLLREQRPATPDKQAPIDYARYPIKQMKARGWVKDLPDRGVTARTLIEDLVQRAGGNAASVALYRRNDHLRTTAKTDPHALQAWCLQVLALANQTQPAAPYRAGTVTPDFLRSLSRMSWSEDAPLQARDFLARHGIILVVLQHLSRTHLDGAALQLADGRPVVALTLRYDRIDSFWFSLLHELAHVGRHLDTGLGTMFVDDLQLREIDAGSIDSREAEADEWAEEALVPRVIWEASAARAEARASAILNLAGALQIHPAIIAGKIRRERGNYRLLSHFVGTGQVRRLFAPSQAPR
jgi:HTH-type transcriptional regulator/antitoxin HigA